MPFLWFAIYHQRKPQFCLHIYHAWIGHGYRFCMLKLVASLPPWFTWFTGARGRSPCLAGVLDSCISTIDIANHAIQSLQISPPNRKTAFIVGSAQEIPQKSSADWMIFRWTSWPWATLPWRNGHVLHGRKTGNVVLHAEEQKRILKSHVPVTRSNP